MVGIFTQWTSSYPFTHLALNAFEAITGLASDYTGV